MKYSFANVLAFFAIISASAANASELISCSPTFKRGDPVTISLNSKSKFGKSLSCIRTMAAEGETCAPNGGTSLLFSTGLGSISRIFEHPNDTFGHAGPMISFFMSADRITFNGGNFNGRNAWTMNWSFVVNRISGLADLKADRTVGVPSGRYRCKKVRQAL